VSCFLLLQGDLTLVHPVESFVSLLKNVFDNLPYILSESAAQIAGLDPATWPQYEVPVKTGL